MVRCQEAQEALACLHVMVVLALLRVAVFPLQTLLLVVVQVARVLGRHPEPLAVQVVHLALRALRVPPLLQAGCLGKAVVVEAVVLLALAELAELEAVALVVAAVVQHAAHTRPVLVA